MPLLLLLYLAAQGEDTRATHTGAYRPSVSPATVTTGQCAAAAQRTLCPTDTITIQDSRSPPSTVKHCGTVACGWCQYTGFRFFFQTSDCVSDNLKVQQVKRVLHKAEWLSGQKIRLVIFLCVFHGVFYCVS